jgi:DNA-binding transcriptional MerR regulator
MSLEQKMDEKFHTTQIKMKELSIEMGKLELEHQKLMKNLGLTPEEIQAFASNESNYSPPIWEQLQQEKKQLDEKLNLSLNNIRDPNKVKKTLSETASIQSHWIFVR